MTRRGPTEVRWAELAVVDLEEVLAFIELDDAVAAVRLGEQIVAACQRLSDQPQRGRVVPELLRIGVRAYRELIVGPYRVVYRPADKVVYVLAVLHGARDVEAVLHRRLTRPR